MQQLTDKFGRKITYLRLAITDRCNLRCQYCMPAQGINIVDRKELLSYKEMYRITRILSELGVNKVRLTGGEPFVRKDFVNFLESLSFNDKLDEINITTNGALISNHITKLEALNINAINLSIDSLQKEKFAKITRRDVFDNVYQTFLDLEKSKLKLKLNIVIQSGFNTDEIIDFIERLEKIPNIQIQRNAMSTQIFGEYRPVMDALNDEIQQVLEKTPQTVFVIKLIGTDRNKANIHAC